MPRPSSRIRDSPMGGSWKMGKNWHGNRGSKGGGHSSHDIPSCKGYPVIMGTCDAARERETSRELVNLLNDAIEALYPRPSAPHSDQADGHGKSIAEMMRAEIEEIKGQKHADTQSVVSINTGVKGIALIKILRKECCPVTLIKHLFERVRREKAALCRYVVRVIPLQRVFYPELEDLQTHFTLIMREALGIAAPAPETVAATPAEEEECAAPAPAADVPEAVVPEAGSKRPLTEDPDTSKEVKKPRTEEHVKFGYCIHYKARNNNILKKDDVHRLLAGCLSGYGYGDYKQPKVVLQVEALKSICGVSWIDGYEDLLDLNIRKFQIAHCGQLGMVARVETAAAKEEGQGEEEAEEEQEDEGDVQEEAV